MKICSVNVRHPLLRKVVPDGVVCHTDCGSSLWSLCVHSIVEWYTKGECCCGELGQEQND